MKITILGSSGSGKSALAKKISTTFNIPCIEIDRIWFKYEGHKYQNASIEEKSQISQKILTDIEGFLETNTDWVIEGTYYKVQPIIAEQADVVVLVIRPLVNRILSHILRVVKGVDRHPEVSKLQDLSFTKTIIRRWRNNENKKLTDFALQYKQKLVVLRNFKEINLYFNTLK